MKALIIVDVQNDFVPGGALAVSGGNEIVPLINKLMLQYPVIVATQDWHPANHGSFSANHPGTNPGAMATLGGLPQILWPVHCVQNTWGAQMHPELDVSKIEKVFQKGTDPEIDSYSGFFDNGHKKSTGLGEWLQERGVTTVDVCGLATDYCVRFTALDAKGLGFDTTLILDASRGVNLKEGDVEASVREMSEAGIKIASRS